MKLFIIDRDGVINKNSKQYIKSVAEWIPIEGSLEAIAQIYHAGWHIAIASNQSAIGRELMPPESLHQIHAHMQSELAEMGARVDGLFFCPHSPDANCNCRKPKPQLLKDIATRFRTKLKDVPFVGDTLKDIQAAQTVGAKPYLVRTGNGMETLAQGHPAKVEVFDDLMDVVNTILRSP